MLSFLKINKVIFLSAFFMVFVLLLTACDTGKEKMPIFGRRFDKKIDGKTRPLDEDIFLSEDMEYESDISKTDAVGYIRIAVLLPLSGPAEKIGTALRNAALLAQYEVGLDNIVLQFYDTGGDAENAVEATKEAIGHGARLIIGPLFSQSVTPVARIANSRGINVITFSNDPYVIGDGIYTIGLMLDQQVERILSYAKDNEYKRFAILAPDNDTGLTIVHSAENLLDNLEIELTKIGYYEPSTNDFSNVVKEISDYEKRVEKLNEEKILLEGKEDEVSKLALKQLEEMETFGDVDFDAVLLVEEGSKLRSLSSMLPYYDVFPSKIKFLGTSLWDDTSLMRENALQGGWFTALPKDRNNDFQKRYERNFAYKTPRVASLAYDAIALASAIARNNSQTRFSKEELTNPNGFAGIDGIFRLHSSGHSERGLAIMEIDKNRAITIDSAPEKFEFY